MLQKDHISKAVYMNSKKKRNIVVCLLDFMKLKICFDTIVKQKTKLRGNKYVVNKNICIVKTYPYPLCERATKRDFKIT